MSQFHFPRRQRGGLITADGRHVLARGETGDAVVQTSERTTPALALPPAASQFNPFPTFLQSARRMVLPSRPMRWPRQVLIVFAMVVILLLLVALAAVSAQQTASPRPAGVTDSSIAWGKALYHGSANCSACHGDLGQGTERGPNLTGGIWLHGPGTYEWLIQQVIHGVPASQSMSGEPMPMRGWVPMNDSDVHAVAAYVWSISHPPQPPPKPKPVPGN